MTDGPGPKVRYTCGTPAAVRRHRRHDEPLDAECRQAERRQGAERKGLRAGAQSIDTREKRNGLPEFVPYVYRGTGCDQYAHLYDEEELCA